MTDIQDGDIVTARGFVRRIAVVEGVQRALVFSAKVADDVRSIWVDTDLLELEERPVKFNFGDCYVYTENAAEVFRVTYVVDDNWISSIGIKVNRKNKTVNTIDTAMLTSDYNFPSGPGWAKV